MNTTDSAVAGGPDTTAGILLEPAEAAGRVRDGALLIDVRGEPRHVLRAAPWLQQRHRVRHLARRRMTLISRPAGSAPPAPGVPAVRRPPRLSFLLRLNGALDPAAQYAAGLELFGVADRLGPHAGWITSHHFAAPQGTIASPFVFLAAAAQRTTRLRLGVGVVVLPLEHPIRVAEDAALLDVLSAGRLELGIGKGLEAWPFPAFGVEYDDRNELFQARARELTAVLGGGELPGGRRLYPPAAGLLGRIWQPSSTLDGARANARAGHGLLASKPKGLSPQAGREHLRAVIDAYRAAAVDAGHRPRVAHSRTVYVAADDTAAGREFRAGIGGSLDDPAVQAQLRAGVVGDPSAVAERLEAELDGEPVDEILVQVIPAKLSLAQWASSLELLARQVWPRLSSRLTTFDVVD